MRNNRKSTDGATDRLGPLASLMRTAEPLDHLSAAERERIKFRLRGELARNRPVASMRLLMVMAGVGLLLAGGVATAGRLGLIRWPSILRTSSPDGEKTGEEPRRSMRNHAKASVPVPLDGNLHVSPEAAPALEPTSPAAPAPVVEVPKPAAVQATPSLPRQQNARVRRVSDPTETTRFHEATDQASSHQSRAPAAFALAPAPGALEPAPSLPPVPRSTPAAIPSLAMVAPEDAYRRVPRTTASPAPNAQDLLGQAMRSLRRQHDPAAALDILARHAALFPQNPLAGERTQLEVEALLALGRYPEALLRLDGMDLAKIPRTAERLVVRGELRAQARRWNEAAADFEQALSYLKGSSPWHERALWGRATSRAQAGDRVGARADMRLYLQTYPQGRFAAQATRLTDQP